MAISTRTLSIFASLLIAAGCIAGAFLLSGRIELTPVNAESTRALLEAYATTDTDADGLADWQESLYGSDPENPRSIDPSMTDKEAVEQGLAEPRFRSKESAEPVSIAHVPGIEAAPGTLTDRFAQEFFGSYLTTRGATTPSQEDLLAFVDEAIESLDKESAAAFSYADLKDAPSGPEAARLYALQVDGAIQTNAIEAKENELVYFSDVVNKGDQDALIALSAMSRSYQQVATAVADVPVPSELRSEHLALVNALARMGEVIGNMAAFENDPLLAFVGLLRYEKSAFSLADAFAALAPELSGVTFTQGEPGAELLELIETAAAR